MFLEPAPEYMSVDLVTLNKQRVEPLPLLNPDTPLAEASTGTITSPRLTLQIAFSFHSTIKRDVRML